MQPLPDALQTASPPLPAVIAWNAAREPLTPSQRCVSLPFTTPALTAMRVRVAPTGGLEMLLGNPAGGRGIYVAGWATLRAFAAPSLHDILLAERVGGPVTLAGPLSPATVRAAAIAVAAEGHAGRRVAQVAAGVQQAEQLGLRRLRAHLLLELARALDLPGSRSAMNDPWTTQPDEHRGWLAEAPLLLARHLEGPSWLPPAELADLVARIAALAWQVGLGPAADRARLPRTLRLLSATVLPERSPGPGAEAGVINLDHVIGARVAQAEAALQQARLLLDDPIGLLALWRTDRAALLQTLEQPDWVLDGWDRLCLLRSDAAELGALAQMLLYEGERRIGLNRAGPDKAGLDGAGLSSLSATAAMNRLARNEQLRLRELQLHDPDLADLDG